MRRCGLAGPNTFRARNLDLLRLRTTLVVWALCLLLVGCTPPRAAPFDGAGAASPTQAGGEVQLIRSSTRPVVKIGLVAPFEGRYRSLGYEALYAVKLAVRDRNAAGGVAGHLVELIALDDGDDPGDSSFQARKFAVDAQVMGVIGPFSEAAARTAAPVYHEVGLASILPATCVLDLPPWAGMANNGAVFCLGADADVLARALIDRLPDGARTALLHVDDGALGDRLRSAADYVVAAPWDEAVLEMMRERPVDVYLYDGDVLGAAELLVKMSEAGLGAPLWGGPSLARTQLPQIAGDAAAGTCYALTAPAFAPPSSGGAFAIGYQESAGVEPGPWAALAYDGTLLLLDALERAIAADGHPTREGVIAALAETRGPDGALAFDLGRRRQAQVAFYCYARGDAYPGTLRP